MSPPTSVALTWTSGATPPFATTLERQQGGGAFAVVASFDAGTTTFTDTGLTAGAIYTYRARSANTAGSSAYSATITVTLPEPPDTMPPTAPAAVAVSNLGSRGFTVTWAPSTDDRAVAGYRVFVNGNEVGRPATQGFAVVGLSPDTYYRVMVVAEDAAGNVSPPSAPLTAETLSGITVPHTVKATGVSATGFALSWKPSRGPVAVYDIYRNDVLIGSTPLSLFIAADLPPLSTFSLRVVARDAAGFSVSSAPLPVPNSGALNASTLNDGIPDTWKLSHGLNPTDASPADGDTDGDGKTNLAEFQLGTDPNDYYENRGPVIVRLGPPGELGPNDTLSLKIADANGQPMVNAPVELTAGEGERLQFDIAYPSAKFVTVRTNAQGIVTVLVEIIEP